MLAVVRMADDPAASARWRADAALSAVEAHPTYGEFGRRYYPAVFGLDRTDQTFFVVEDDRPLLMVACSTGCGAADYYGSPIRFFVGAVPDAAELQRAVGVAFDYLFQLIEPLAPIRITVADHAGLGVLSAVGKQCLNRNATAAIRLNAICDLSSGEAKMKQSMRKSFRSLVNWGERNLRVSCVDRDAPSRDLFTRYQDFHRTIAGRTTRPDESWDIMFDWIASGRGDLVLGFTADDELVAGTLVVDGTTTASYASGVYDRERFDQPMAHWPMWVAMLRSAQRGLRTFDIGAVPLTDTASPKEVAIGYFKRGFATDITTWAEWSVDTLEVAAQEPA